MFDHRCLRSIGKIWWEHRISNTEVRRRVLGPKNISVIEQLHHHRLRWLEHVLRVSDDRLPRRVLFTEPKSSWKRPSGGQHMTWQRNMKSLTEGLSRVGNVRLAGWGPRDPSHLWLENSPTYFGCDNYYKLLCCLHGNPNQRFTFGSWLWNWTELNIYEPLFPKICFFPWRTTRFTQNRVQYSDRFDVFLFT